VVAADRVKQIKTDAKVNQVQTAKLIASLIAEKEKLLRDLDAANRSGTPTDGFTCDGYYPLWSLPAEFNNSVKFMKFLDVQ